MLFGRLIDPQIDAMKTADAMVLSRPLLITIQWQVELVRSSQVRFLKFTLDTHYAQDIRTERAPASCQLMYLWLGHSHEHRRHWLDALFVFAIAAIRAIATVETVDRASKRL